MSAALRLVYPPISNQEAEWVKSDKAAESVLRQSDFYLMATRHEVRFHGCRVEDSGNVHIFIDGGEGLYDEVILEPFVIAKSFEGFDPEELVVDLGPKIIKFYVEGDVDIDENTEPLEWFSTEKLIFDRSRNLPGIHAFERYREFATYNLLYVGIAKASDTFDRLFEGAHHARQKILSNEHPHRIGARVSDELILFPFELVPTVIREVGTAPAFEGGQVSRHHHKVIVADAEKAFIHLLKPEYNVTQYADYPRSSDGLYGASYQSYGFYVEENLIFVTKNQILHGHLDHRRADVLEIAGDIVRLRKSTGTHSQNDLCR
jgi:hypothetical protein